MSDKNKTEIKSCPFCGSTKLSMSRYVRDDKHWHVSCPQYDCVMYGYSACGYNTREEAVDKWNTRASAPQADNRKLVAIIKTFTSFEFPPTEAGWKDMVGNAEEDIAKYKNIPA